MSSRRYNFENRKSVHINLMLGTHGEFRARLLKKGLTMQDALEECASKIAQGDPYMEKLLNELVEKKIKGELRVAVQEAESIYRLIEKEDD